MSQFQEAQDAIDEAKRVDSAVPRVFIRECDLERVDAEGNTVYLTTSKPFEGWVPLYDVAPRAESRLEKRLAEIEKHAANLVATARNHFPKSIHNPDKFELELFSALLNNKATS